MKKRIPPCCAAFLLAAVVILASCSKGTAGANGQTGPKGDTGTANVLYSAWADDTFNVASSSATTINYVSRITAPKLTTAILDSGAVMIYFNINTTADMIVVHLDYNGYGLTDLFNIYAKLEAGKIFLYSVNQNISTTVVAGQKYFQYRYILIPGGAHLRSAINWDDYNQVKVYLGLKD